MDGMPVRLKKLIGTILLILLVVIYALVAVTIAAARLADAGSFAHFLYFLVTGFLWVIPAMFLIRWMEKTPKQKG